MFPFSISLRISRLVLPALVAAVMLGIISSLAGHGEALLRAAQQLAGKALLCALALCVLHRFVNAAGWGLVLRALGQNVRPLDGARLWLTSEACRWLPGSFWSYGSRSYLASRRGISAQVVAASLILEVIVTVSGWLAVVGPGYGDLRKITWQVPEGGMPGTLIWITIGTVLVGSTAGLVASRSARLRARVRSLFSQVTALRQLRVDPHRLGGAYVFYIAMAAFNGAVLLLIIRSEPGGAAVPAGAVLAANAVAWLTGFFAPFAPGGLVVREACLVTLLAPWMPADQLLVIALAWRLVQIVAEVVCFVTVAAWGVPESLVHDPDVRKVHA